MKTVPEEAYQLLERHRCVEDCKLWKREHYHCKEDGYLRKILKKSLYLDNFQAINSEILQSEIRTRILKVRKKEKWSEMKEQKQKSFVGSIFLIFFFPKFLVTFTYFINFSIFTPVKMRVWLKN